MFRLNKIAIIGLFFHADHNVRGLDNSSPVFNDVVSAEQRSHVLIQEDSRKMYENDDWREGWNYDVYFYNNFHEKCLGFDEYNDSYTYGELIDCDDEESHFSIEKLRSDLRRSGVWKIRHNDDECVGVDRIKHGQELALYDCDDEDNEKLLWILGEVDEYDQIRPALNDDLCIRNAKLSDRCGGNDEKNLFKNKRIQTASSDYYYEEDEEEYRTFENRRCKTDRGDSGSHGEEYFTYDNNDSRWSKTDCKNYCSDNFWCTGFEWNPNPNGNCEVWFYDSDEFKVSGYRVNGASCNWKN